MACLERKRQCRMPRILLCECRLDGTFDAGDAALQINTLGGAEHIQVADARIDPQTIAGRIAKTEIPLPRCVLFNRNECGNLRRPSVDIVRANLHRLEQSSRSDALLCTLDGAAAEEIAGRKRKASADDAIVHVLIPRDVDRPEESDCARL